MKATIDINGMLKVKAENETEAYALVRWADQNIALTENLEVGYCLDDFEADNKHSETFGITSSKNKKP